MANWRDKTKAPTVTHRGITLTNIVLTNIGSSVVRPFGAIGTMLYGFNNSGNVLFRSTDNGANWTQVTGITLGNPVGGTGNCRAIYQCTDGQVLVLRDNNLVKSVGWGGATPTWTTKATLSTPTGGTSGSFKEWGIAFDGAHGILSEYHNDWTVLSSATNVWVTEDGGNTWNIELSTGTAPFTDYTCHWHGVCVDTYSDRFYVSMGHGYQVGLWVRDFNSATWYAVDIETHKLDTLRSTSSTDPLYSCFTQLCATPRGIYAGTDDFPAAIIEVRSNQATSSQRGEVICVDDEVSMMPWWMECGLSHSSGAVFMGTKLTPSVTSQEPRLYGCIDGKASMLWEFPIDPLTNTNVSFRSIIDDGDGGILAVLQINTGFYTLTADVSVG
jgi:hypothetical protein